MTVEPGSDQLMCFVCLMCLLFLSVGIEYSLCELICVGDPNGPLVIEGRQPAVMENFLRTRLNKVSARRDNTCEGRTRIAAEHGIHFSLSSPYPSPSLAPVPSRLQRATFRLRLTCTVREQASRFIEREYGTEMVASLLPHLSSDATRLSELTPGLQRLARPELAKLLRAFDDNDSRDEDDRRRFNALYGTSEFLDHRVRHTSRASERPSKLDASLQAPP